jgi:pimeloyl-ACP methyl ester carboxylesterase
MGRQDARFFASHLTELLDHLDLKEDFDLYGYSMGGSIAAAYAVQNPSSVKQLILLAPAGMGHKLGNLFGWVSRVWGLGDWLVYARYPRLHLAGTEAERAISSSVSFLIERQQKELHYRGFIPAILSSARGILAHKMAAEHSAIQRHGIRVLAIWGGQDHVIPVALKGCLQSWNPQARQFVIWDAGHALPYSHTQQVTALLEAELQAIPRLSS